MELVYKKHDNEIRPISESGMLQVIVGEVRDGSNRVVMFVDMITGKTYIEKIGSMLLIDPYISSNLIQITDDEEFKMYKDAFKAYGIL